MHREVASPKTWALRIIFRNLLLLQACTTAVGLRWALLPTLVTDNREVGSLGLRRRTNPERSRTAAWGLRADTGQF
jgi:hypothetical protein